MKIQKSLILDFDFESAQDSAQEDWKIDIERETFDKRNTKSDTLKNPLPKINELEEINNEELAYEQEEPTLIDYERLSEFFFDLCLSWC